MVLTAPRGFKLPEGDAVKGQQAANQNTSAYMPVIAQRVSDGDNWTRCWAHSGQLGGKDNPKWRPYGLSVSDSHIIPSTRLATGYKKLETD